MKTQLLPGHSLGWVELCWKCYRLSLYRMSQENIHLTEADGRLSRSVTSLDNDASASHCTVLGRGVFLECRILDRWTETECQNSLLPAEQAQKWEVFYLVVGFECKQTQLPTLCRCTLWDPASLISHSRFNYKTLNRLLKSSRDNTALII